MTVTAVTDGAFARPAVYTTRTLSLQPIWAGYYGNTTFAHVPRRPTRHWVLRDLRAVARTEATSGPPNAARAIATALAVS